MIPGVVDAKVNAKAILETEAKVAGVVSFLAPLTVLLLAPVLRGLAHWLVVLQPPAQWTRLAAFSSAGTWALFFVALLVPLAWRTVALRQARRGESIRQGLPVAALAAVVLFALANVILVQHRVFWTIDEASKIRLEPFSFLRALASWRTTPAAASDQTTVLAVGSSQINSALCPDRFRLAAPSLGLIKRALPGLCAMQYAAAWPGLRACRPDFVVCWISEFDMFRDDELPVNRLRYFVTAAETAHIAADLGAAGLWRERGALADLATAALCPLWRHRDLLRNLATQLWWKAPPSPPASEAQRQRDFQRVVDGMAAAVRRGRLLEANFLSFSRFARMVADSGAKLIVVEGSSHPAAMAVYDPAFRTETRLRLQAISRQTGFEYFSAAQMPAFSGADFADPAHLNADASACFTDWLAALLSRRCSPQAVPSVPSARIKESPGAPFTSSRAATGNTRD